MRASPLPQPAIAALDGQVIGDGLGLALAADLRIASETASFRVPEAEYGFIPGWGVAHALEAVVGRAVTLEMLLTGAAVDARRAHAVGLVSRVVPLGRALAAAVELADGLARKSPLALAWSKRVLRDAPGASAATAWEEECFSRVWGSPDWQEGIAALFSRRAPVFPALAR